MKKLIIDKLPRITRNRKKLQEKLDVNITNRGKEFFIEGKPEDEFIAEKVLESLDFGFPFSVAILIKEEDYDFETLNIKDYTTRKNLEQVRGRLIGKGGKVLKTLSDLTNCYFELKDNNVGIVGDAEEIKNAIDAVVLIIQGSKHGNVYKHLEKLKPDDIGDLGLRK